MRKPISLKEIAQLAYISHPTVSRALKNRPLISQSTGDRIRRMTAERGYQPNRNARSLVTQRSNFVGCVVTDIADPFIGEVISGVEEVAAQHDYSIILTNSGGDPDREMEAVRSLVEKAIDGVLVIAAMAGGAPSPYFSEREIPIVLINNHYPGNVVHSIGVANFEGHSGSHSICWSWTIAGSDTSATSSGTSRSRPLSRLSSSPQEGASPVCV